MSTNPATKQGTIRQKIADTLLDTGACAWAGLEVGEGRLAEQLDISTLLAARKHAMTGQHAAAIRLLCTAMDVAAGKVADDLLDRASKRPKALPRRVRIERAGNQWFLDYEAAPGSWKNHSVHDCLDTAVYEKARLALHLHGNVSSTPAPGTPSPTDAMSIAGACRYLAQGGLFA